MDIDTVKPLIGKYIGSLPKGRKALKWSDDGVRIQKGRIEDILTVDMQTPKSTVLQYHTAYLPYTPERKAALDAISYILDIRYVNSLREDEGGTYGAHSSVSFNRRPEERVSLQVSFDCRPSVCDKLRDLAIQGIRDLAENGPTEEEVTNAVLNLRKNIPERRLTNAYWQGAIESYERYGRDRDADNEAAVNALTGETIRRVLREVLAQGNLIEVVMKPANTAEAE